MKLISLSDGTSTKVSDDDYIFLLGFKWSRNFGGYAYRTTYDRVTKKKHSVYMARVVAERKGTPPGDLDVDHLDRDKSNNQRENLEPKTRSRNKMNVSPCCLNKTGFKGISIAEDGRYNVTIKVNGKSHYIGRSADFSAAVKMRLDAELEYFKEVTQ